MKTQITCTATTKSGQSFMVTSRLAYGNIITKAQLGDEQVHAELIKDKRTENEPKVCFTGSRKGQFLDFFGVAPTAKKQLMGADVIGVAIDKNPKQIVESLKNELKRLKDAYTPSKVRIMVTHNSVHVSLYEKDDTIGDKCNITEELSKSLTKALKLCGLELKEALSPFHESTDMGDYSITSFYAGDYVDIVRALKMITQKVQNEDVKAIEKQNLAEAAKKAKCAEAVATGKPVLIERYVDWEMSKNGEYETTYYTYAMPDGSTKHRQSTIELN